MGVPLHGHDLVEHLFPLRPPRDDEIAELLDTVRDEYLSLGHMIAELMPAGPDATVAIRKLHDALQATIGAIVLNQEDIK